MATEDLTGAGKFIDDLVATNPVSSDLVSSGDEHLRGVKNVLKNSFGAVTGAVTATHTELNYTDGVTSAIQTQIDNITTDVVGDTTPQLGGNLDLNSQNVTGTGAWQGTAIADGYVASASTWNTANTTANAALPKAGGTMTGNLNLGDSNKIQLGASQDLQIFHDGSNSNINEVGSGNLYIRGENLFLDNAAGSKRFVGCTASSGEVGLYHSNLEKIKTTSSGVSVTGNIAVNGTVDGRDVGADGGKLDGVASGATNVTNNNQLTNGAGYVTSGGLSHSFISSTSSVTGFTAPSGGTYHATCSIAGMSSTGGVKIYKSGTVNIGVKNNAESSGYVTQTNNTQNGGDNQKEGLTFQAVFASGAGISFNTSGTIGSPRTIWTAVRTT
jgi:hypothetical protein